MQDAGGFSTDHPQSFPHPVANTSLKPQRNPGVWVPAPSAYKCRKSPKARRSIGWIKGASLQPVLLAHALIHKHHIGKTNRNRYTIHTADTGARMSVDMWGAAHSANSEAYGRTRSYMQQLPSCLDLRLSGDSARRIQLHLNLRVTAGYNLRARPALDSYYCACYCLISPTCHCMQ